MANPVTSAIKDASGAVTTYLVWDSPAYANAAKTAINLTLYTPHGAMPFTLVQNDPGAAFDTAAFWSDVQAAATAGTVTIAPFA